MDRDRLRRIRNFQSDDWYPALVMRPLTILVMLVIGDWRWLTPNRLTSLANLFKVAGIVLIVPAWAAGLGIAPWPATVAAVVLLQLGILFDHLDGTMARYRLTFTTFGSFYDKASDVITWFALCFAVGWRGYVDSGKAELIVLAGASAAMLTIRGYMKWLMVAESEKLRWREAAADPTGVIARRTAPPRIAPPPERTPAEWARWFGRSLVQVYRFEEMDLFFWVGLGLLLGRTTELCWLLAVSQSVGFVGMTITRHLEADQVDRTARA